MPSLKVATFNVEWMVSVFGGRWADWETLGATIPDTFAGRSLGPINIPSVADVPGLCRRIAGVIKRVNAKVIGIQEGPPLKQQLELFVERFLDDAYAVYTSNSTWQTIHALVHRSINDNVTAFAPNAAEVKALASKVGYYGWGDVGKNERKLHSFDRMPLVLRFRPAANKEVRFVVVHTKSKISKLKTRQQWEARDREAVLDALDSRRKLSAEMFQLRQYLDTQLAPPDQDAAVVVMGDFNDGPFAELIEREFLIHNVIDELVGSFLNPARYFKHAMEPDALATATTTRFPDPLEGGAMTAELIDHMLVSPGIWTKKAPFHLRKNSCKVETAAYDQFNADAAGDGERGLRPSDHRPVSATLTY
jgi:endonuclease/exonuclease/phosphatase family metal-dependent hydrolase